MLNPRDSQRVAYVIQALETVFKGVTFHVTPLKAIGGHMNVNFWCPSTTQFLDLLHDTTDKLIPPGWRYPWTFKGHVWSLHVPETHLGPDCITGRAHIDRGDPDRDVAGMFTHTFYDGLWGHLHPDLDPR